MASHNHLFLFLGSQIFIFLNHSFAMPLITNDATPLINQVCQKTQDFNFCVEFLTSDQRSAAADLKGLAHISLELTCSNAQDTEVYIHSLLDSGPEPGLKQVLDHCSINYGGSVYGLLQGIASLDADNNYDFANEMSIVAWENANDCQRVLNEGTNEPSVANLNKRMVKLSDISRVVTGALKPA